MIQTVPDQKFVRRVETDEPRGMTELCRDVFVQHGADFERTGFTIVQQIDEPVERTPRIDDVFDQQDVFTLQFRFRIIEETDHTTRLHRIAVRRRNQEIHLQGSFNVTHEIAEEDEASFQQAEHEQVPVGVMRRDFGAKLLHAFLDGLRVVHDAPKRPSIEPWVNRAHVHIDTR